MLDVPLKSLAKKVYQRVDERRLVGLASEAAFWLVLALVPLAAVAAMLAANFALHEDGAMSPLVAAIPVTARDFMSHELDALAAFRHGRVAPIAALTFLWLASSGIHGLFDAFEACTGVTARAWWKKRGIALLSCVVLSLGVAAIAVIAEGWDRLYGAIGSSGGAFETGVMSTTETSIRAFVGASLDLALILAVFTVGIPKSSRAPRRVLPGAVVALLAQVVLGFGYAVVLHTVGDSSAYLASLAAVAIIMTTCFLFCFSLLVGVAVNVALDELRPKHHVATTGPQKLQERIEAAPPLLRHAGAGLRWVLGRRGKPRGPGPSARDSLPR